ncbi:hypothetical protein G7Y89_g3963 [Cudoniella acicularis]|uniref:Uncharacterized protein n=1 Tax=Cudoniella acicularis TaxID=354080 RepID=A0A8H4RTC5_9HELO|nr:hypothetical protein G7Y89_g3963 [Cudoniella acicularis]
MDYEWTPFDRRPQRLYRLIFPATRTTYDPNFGIKAANRTLMLPYALNTPMSFLRAHMRKVAQQQANSPEASEVLNTIGLQDNPGACLQAFLDSVHAHRTGAIFAHGSPFISFFEDKGEAEAWALAAEEIWGADRVALLAVNPSLPMMRGVMFWKVSDIQDRFKEPNWGIQWEDGVDRRPPTLCQYPRNSEWLALYGVPKESFAESIYIEDIRGEPGRFVNRLPYYRGDDNGLYNGVPPHNWGHSYFDQPLNQPSHPSGRTHFPRRGSQSSKASSSGSRPSDSDSEEHIQPDAEGEESIRDPNQSPEDGQIINLVTPSPPGPFRHAEVGERIQGPNQAPENIGFMDLTSPSPPCQRRRGHPSEARGRFQIPNQLPEDDDIIDLTSTPSPTTPSSPRSVRCSSWPHTEQDSLLVSPKPIPLRRSSFSPHNLTGSRSPYSVSPPALTPSTPTEPFPAFDPAYLGSPERESEARIRRHINVSMGTPISNQPNSAAAAQSNPFPFPLRSNRYTPDPTAIFHSRSWEPYLGGLNEGFNADTLYDAPLVDFEGVDMDIVLFRDEEHSPGSPFCKSVDQLFKSAELKRKKGKEKEKEKEGESREDFREFLRDVKRAKMDVDVVKLMLDGLK